MSIHVKIGLFALLCLVAVLTAFLQLHGGGVDVLNPKGLIAEEERSLIYIATALMMVVVIPVFIMTGFIAWRYREGNTKARYSPDWDGHKVLESIWWGFPFVIIVVLSVITWKSTHELDPFKPIEGSGEALTVQVISLDWKWLFIYPDQKIATVNYARIPEGRPVRFEITSDAPMNSFWIPQLGGQIYAMSGMSTHLHLMADEAGSYRGSSANISGKGFAGMDFRVEATTESDFDRWVVQAQESTGRFGQGEYDNLRRPSEDNPIATYALADAKIYSNVLARYSSHGAHVETAP